MISRRSCSFASEPDEMVISLIARTGDVVPSGYASTITKSILVSPCLSETGQITCMNSVLPCDAIHMSHAPGSKCTYNFGFRLLTQNARRSRIAFQTPLNDLSHSHPRLSLNSKRPAQVERNPSNFGSAQAVPLSSPDLQRKRLTIVRDQVLRAGR